MTRGAGGTRVGRARTLVLAIGFVALALGVLAARSSPADGYELSIYASTPTLYWVGLSIAVVVAGVVGFAPGTTDRDRVLASGLVALAGVALAGLPLLRGYHYLGGGDSLSHLGWARELADGSLAPSGLLYPGLHELTVVLGTVTAAPSRRAMMFAVLAFAVVFLVSVPLCVRVLAARRDGLLVGAFLALVLVPINVVSIHLLAHTSSQAVTFVPFVFFLLLVYLVRGGDTTEGSGTGRGSGTVRGNDTTEGSGTGRGSGTVRGNDTTEGSVSTTAGTSRGDRGGRNALRNPVTGIGSLLFVALVALILVHPQQAANLLVVFVAIAFVQFLARWLDADSVAASHRPLYAQTGAFALAFALWTPRFDRVGGNTTAMVQNLVYGGGGGTAVVDEKSTSLTAVGGSIPELFAKLFFTGAVVSTLTAILVYVAFARGLAASDHQRNQLVRYLGVALVPLSAMFVLVFFGGPGDMYFRYQGLLMVPATILAGVALARGFGRGGLARNVPRAASAALLVVVLVLVALGVASVFPSPYVYQPNDQVTEAEMTGYATAFEVRADDLEFTGIRSGPRRYVDAYYGTNHARNDLEFPGYEDAVTGAAFTNGLGDRFESDRYFAVGDSSRSIEVGLYGELRYGEQGFDRLDADSDVHRVVDNGGFELYYLEGDDDADDEDGIASRQPPHALTERRRGAGEVAPSSARGAASRGGQSTVIPSTPSNTWARSSRLDRALVQSRSGTVGVDEARSGPWGVAAGVARMRVANGGRR